MLPLIATASVGPSVENPGGSSRRAAIAGLGRLEACGSLRLHGQRLEPLRARRPGCTPRPGEGPVDVAEVAAAGRC